MSKDKKKTGFMQRMMDWMSEKVMPTVGKIGEQKHIVSITRGMMATIPLTIIGGISLIIAYPPIDPAMVTNGNFFTNFLLSWYNWANANITILEMANNVTLGILGIYACFAIAYHLSVQYEMTPLPNCMTAMMSFIILCGAPTKPAEGVSGLWMYTRYLGSRGLFAGMIIAILSVEIIRFLLKHNIKIRLPDNVPPMVTQPFEALIPGLVIVVLSIFVDWACNTFFGFNMPQAIMEIFRPFARAVDSAAGMTGIQFLINFLWFFGIYGSAVPDSVTSSFFFTNLTANAEAYAAGTDLPAIATGAFRPAFGNIGGCGSALALALCILIFARSVHLRSVAKVGVIPTFFGIAEPMTFGVPLVFNPVLLVPMILSSCLNTFITFSLMSANIIGRQFVNVPWTTPKPFDAFLSTMDWKAAVLQILLIVMDIFIYMPFVKVYDKSLIEKEQAEAIEAGKA